MDGGDPVIRRCRINRNGGVAISASKKATGTVETCDLTGNAYGAWHIDRGCHVRRIANKE
jgi:hypothetical protein